jgi:hypothetical protein
VTTPASQGDRRRAATGPRDEQLRSPLLLAVFFGGFVPPSRLASLVEEYRGRHRRGPALAGDMLAALGDDTNLPGAALLRRAAYEEMMISWLGEVLDRIPAGTDHGNDPVAGPAATGPAATGAAVGGT